MRSAAVPIYQTTSHIFAGSQYGADLFDLKVMGNIYTLEMILRLVKIGDAKLLARRHASTTHRQPNDQELATAVTRSALIKLI